MGNKDREGRIILGDCLIRRKLSGEIRRRGFGLYCSGNKLIEMCQIQCHRMAQ